VGGEPFLLVMVTEDEDVKTVRLPLSSGIVGAVASSGEAQCIVDAYEDHRFNSDLDKETGFRTKAILAFPVRDSHGDIVGVLQAINKLTDTGSDGSFSSLDQEICSMLSTHIGIALTNAKLYEQAIRSKERTDATLALVKAIHMECPSASSLMFALHSKIPHVVEAERCSFFMADHHHNELWAIQGDVDVRVPMEKGIIGHVATTKETVRIPDAYLDSRWSGHSIDKQHGYRTRAILSMPLIGSSGQVVGVVQCINKTASSGLAEFTEEDQDVLGTLLSVVAPAIEHSAMFAQHASKATVADESEFSGPSFGSDHARSAAATAQPAIEETEEEEEEEEAA
jgi:GAF domain-containing protein